MKSNANEPATEANSSIDERVRKLVEGGFFGDPGKIFPIIQTRALWTIHDGSTTRFHEFFGKHCYPSRILDVCGTVVMGSDGTREFNLKDFVCIPKPSAGTNFYVITPPAFVVATARSASPAYLTSQVTVQNREVFIKLFAWDSSGAPVAGVSADWHCCVELLEVVG